MLFFFVLFSSVFGGNHRFWDAFGLYVVFLCFLEFFQAPGLRRIFPGLRRIYPGLRRIYPDAVFRPTSVATGKP